MPQNRCPAPVDAGRSGPSRDDSPEPVARKRYLEGLGEEIA